MVLAMSESAKIIVVEAQIEENVRRSTRQKGLTARLKDYDLFHNNEVNDDGDFFHIALMAES